MTELSLDKLAAQEAAIGGLVGKLEGSMEEKATLLAGNGTFQRYAEIFDAYIALATGPSQNLEALKRATFLAWYELTEPSCFTGLGALPSGARVRVADLLEASLPSPDSELPWMLAYYHLIADYAFPSGAERPHLQLLFMTADPDSWKDSRDKPGLMAGRGQMGRYWQSIFAA